MAMMALCLRDYHMTRAEWLASEPSFVNLLCAASCEHAGMKPVDSYRDKEIMRLAPRIMAGELEEWGY